LFPLDKGVAHKKKMVHKAKARQGHKTQRTHNTLILIQTSFLDHPLFVIIVGAGKRKKRKRVCVYVALSHVAAQVYSCSVARSRDPRLDWPSSPTRRLSTSGPRLQVMAHDSGSTPLAHTHHTTSLASEDDGAQRHFYRVPRPVYLQGVRALGSVLELQ